MTKNSPHNIEDFAKHIGIKFNDQNLFRQVFVHRSYLNENPDFDLKHNERLEFLGDAVLELVVTEYLYENFENPEGELTNLRSALVKGVMLSSAAGEIEMDKYLFLSRGESKSEGKSRQLILANAYEALIGAIYLDSGYEASKKFLKRFLIKNLNEIIDKKLYLDPKSNLQEMSQDQLNITPNYKVLSEEGPDHNKKFTVGCFLKDKQAGKGIGSSKQNAESLAARDTLDHWENS